MARPTILTIGHSNHALEKLLALLDGHGVAAVADVRSSPYSRFRPHFNRRPLEQALRDHGIEYVFLGVELGARPKDPSCYEGGRVQYRKLAQTNLFQAGLGRVAEAAQVHRLALLCAEKEPLECHRTFLVGRELEAQGFPVAHIHADGHLEPSGDAMTRLLGMVGMRDEDLFRTREERIAYVDPSIRDLHSIDGSP